MISIFQSPEKREALLQKKELTSYGLTLSEISSNTLKNRAFLCMVRGLLIFLATFGTLGGLISAFELPFHLPLVLGGLLLISMYIAFLYYNRLTFYIGYVFLFIAFSFSIFASYWYVNSGYQAFVNTVYEKYSDYFYLASVRQATEYITNRTITVSVAMLFVGTFLSILLNITISNHMSLLQTFLVTFPLLQIAFYIQARPSLLYLAMLLSVYITVGFLSRSGHFRMPSLKNPKQEFSRICKKDHQLHSYLSNGWAMLTLTFYSILFSTLFLFLCSGLFYSDLGSRYTQNLLKNTTDEYVKIFIQNGISGVFDRYSGTGGLNNGMLGGVSSVRPDYETDLEVTFVPYSSESIYLKGYTGVYYDQNLFAARSPEEMIMSFVPPTATFNDYLPLPQSERYARMYITPIDTTEILYPYDTYEVLNPTSGVGIYQYRMSTGEKTTEAIQAFAYESEIATDLPNEAMEILFIPYESLMYYEPNPEITEEMEANIYANCLQVPDYLTETLDAFCQEANLYELKEAAEQATTYEEAQQARLSIASALKRYFATEFYYTMAPGTAPRNTDSIEYFLTEQRRGYCAHFASSAAVILRHLGIPTRYAEGYCMQLSDILDATAVSTNTTGWFEGENALVDSGVVTVELSDGAAHAWIEIYIDGYGWIPYEMTPPSTEDTIDTLNFASIFSGLLQTAGNASATIGDAYDGLTVPEYNFSFDLEGTFGFLVRPLLYLIAGILLLILLICMIKIVLRQRRIRSLINAGHYGEALLIPYKNFILFLDKKKLYRKKASTLRDVTIFLESRLTGEIPQQDLHFFADAINKAAYGPEGITLKQYEGALSVLKCITTKIKEVQKKEKQERNKKGNA